MPTADTSHKRPFVITRMFDGPRAEVFAAWTKAEHLGRWFGPKGMSLRVARCEIRPGGVFHYAMSAPTGQVMWGRWHFREVQAPDRLVFVSSFSDEQAGQARAPFAATFPLDVLSEVTFADEGSRTCVTLAGTPLDASDAERATFEGMVDQMHQGWNGMFDALAAHLAEGAPAATPVADQRPAVTLHPYLSFPGTCEQAFRFYAGVFGGEPSLMPYSTAPEGATPPMPAEWSSKIMHAALMVGGAPLMGADAPPAWATPMQGFSISIAVTTIAEAERLYDALVQGGTVRMPLAQTFWAARFGMLVDRFGTPWMVNCEKDA